MMKNKLNMFILVIIIMLIAGCSSGTGSTNNDSGNGNSNNHTEGENNEANDNVDEEGVEYTFDSDISGEIDYWTWDVMFEEEDIIEKFNEVYPNIKVNLTILGYGELFDKVETTLLAGSGAPDVAHIAEFEIPRYQSEGLLEDLLQPPYNAERYKDLQSDYNWERWKSVDGKRLLGMPWDVQPGVFFYRTDLYEQVGLPTDPEELGEFLQDSSNVLTAAQMLASNDIYMYEFRDSPAIQYGEATGYFDSEYNYLRNDEKMIDLLDVVKQGVQLDWAPQMSIFNSDEGRQLVKQGKVASFPLGMHGSRQLEELFPEQSGDWSVTRMPLDINVGLGGSTFVIPSQSDNNEAAWAFIEWISMDEEAWKIYVEKAVHPGFSHITSLPWFQEHTNDYLGGIEDYKFYDTIVDRIPVRRMTPLDGLAWPVYIDAINESIDDNIDSRATLQQIEDDTMKQLSSEIEALKEEMGTD